MLASRLLYHSKRIIRSCYQVSCASDVAVSFQIALPVAVLPTTRKLLEPVVSIEEAVKSKLSTAFSPDEMVQDSFFEAVDVYSLSSVVGIESCALEERIPNIQDIKERWSLV